MSISYIPLRLILCKKLFMSFSICHYNKTPEVATFIKRVHLIREIVGCDACILIWQECSWFFDSCRDRGSYLKQEARKVMGLILFRFITCLLIELPWHNLRSILTPLEDLLTPNCLPTSYLLLPIKGSHCPITATLRSIY